MPAACRTISAIGQVGDALPVREAPAADDAGPVADGPEEFGNEAALAHAGRAEDREELARPTRDGAFEGLLERIELAFPSDHRCIEAATVPLGAGGDLVQPVGDHGLRLALELDRLGRTDLHRIAHELVGRAADDDLARRGGRLEPGGDVDGVADDDRLTRPARSDDDGARC